MCRRNYWSGLMLLVSLGVSKTYAQDPFVVDTALSAVLPQSLVNSISLADMDNDGHDDIFLSQNFFAYQVETSRSDAGRGLWLSGDGAGNLRTVPGHKSGVLIHGEQRGTAVADINDDGNIDILDVIQLVNIILNQ